MAGSKEILSGTETTAENTLQRNFFEQYGKKYSYLFGDRLYTNTELLNRDFQPTTPKNFVLLPAVRLLHFFLRNGRTETFQHANELGCAFHETRLDKEHPLTKLFQDAGIHLEGKNISWIEVPNGNSGNISRSGKKYGGTDENILTVEAYQDKVGPWVMMPAQNAGYTINTHKEFEGVIANEMTHEILHTYFPVLFQMDDLGKLVEPFRSFNSQAIPGLKFKGTYQAGEFLSDVSNWVTGGKNGVYFRFFNPIFYMDSNGMYYRRTDSKPEEDRYWYSYQVQRYAMIKILREKGHAYPEKILKAIFLKAESLNKDNEAEFYEFMRHYFTEDDFEKIANIYRQIGVELLKKMKTYYKAQ